MATLIKWQEAIFQDGLLRIVNEVEINPYICVKDFFAGPEKWQEAIFQGRQNGQNAFSRDQQGSLSTKTPLL